MTNASKDTTLKWSKDGAALPQADYDPPSGVAAFTIPQVVPMLIDTRVPREWLITGDASCVCVPSD